MLMTPTRLRVLFVAVLVAVLVGSLIFRDRGQTPGAGIAAAVHHVPTEEPAVRDLVAYEGLGAWVDAFDFADAYQRGGSPSVTPDAIDEMAASGVRTLYIQAARNDARSPEGIVDRERLAQFLVRAHRHGLRVVAWYLPTFADVAVDFRNVERMSEFEVLGHRFDGIAIDIEFTDAVPDHGQRNQHLIALSEQVRGMAGTDVLGAIVLPPVQTEVVNPALWPEFPWTPLADIYDVWLPMSYWTFRSADSGYHDGYTYNEESTRRLRANLGRPDAAVHGIGGIGDQTTPDELDRFVDSLVDTGSVGGSIYDWATLGPDGRRHLAASFRSGAAADLAAG